MEPVWSSRYALTRRTQLEIGSKSRSFWIVIPYSISVPITLGIAIGSPHGPASSGSEVLTRVDVLDRPFLAADSRDQRAHVDDPLTLATGDPGPVVGVRGVRQVLVLLELLADRLVDVFRLDPALAGVDQPLHGLLLGARDDVLDHRTAREVLEVEDLALALRVGDLEELVLVGRRVHALDGLRDQAAHDLRRVAAPALLRLLVERQIGGEVLREDVVGGLAAAPPGRSSPGGCWRRSRSRSSATRRRRSPTGTAPPRWPPCRRRCPTRACGRASPSRRRRSRRARPRGPSRAPA